MSEEKIEIIITGKRRAGKSRLADAIATMLDSVGADVTADGEAPGSKKEIDAKHWTGRKVEIRTTNEAVATPTRSRKRS